MNVALVYTFTVPDDETAETQLARTHEAVRTILNLIDTRGVACTATIGERAARIVEIANAPEAPR